MQNFFAEICDVVINGRSAAESTGEKHRSVDWPELIKRKISTVRINGKIYRVTVERLSNAKVRSEASHG